MIADPYANACIKSQNNRRRIERDIICLRFWGIFCKVTDEPIFTKNQAPRASLPAPGNSLTQVIKVREEPGVPGSGVAVGTVEGEAHVPLDGGEVARGLV